MDNDIRHRIAQLPSLSRQQLLELWKESYARAAPPGMRRELMVPFLAYRLQEQAYGSLKPAVRRELRRIAHSLETPGSSSTSILRPALKPGTRIVRHWQEKKHEIVVTESGFEYNGTNFRSLSQIARKITGTNWSGPAFFGLKRGIGTEELSND